MGQGIRAGQTISSIPFGFDRNGRPLRTWRRRKDVSLRSCFLYPIVDGPGIALLIVLPPFLAIMALPVLDMMVHFRPENALSPVSLLIIPFTLPLVASFGMTIGYVLLFLGRVLTSSATGELDHPRWPNWDRMEIMDELGRWIWAVLMGMAVGGLPAEAYYITCGSVDWMDQFLFLDLLIVGSAYAQMALMAALLHETLLAANPITVCRAIRRLGWDYFSPCLVTGMAIALDLAAWSTVLLHSPGAGVGVIGLGACWVLTLYLAMLIARVMGTTYYRHSEKLGWFQTANRS